MDPAATNAVAERVEPKLRKCGPPVDCGTSTKLGRMLTNDSLCRESSPIGIAKQHLQNGLCPLAQRWVQFVSDSRSFRDYSVACGKLIKLFEHACDGLRLWRSLRKALGRQPCNTELRSRDSNSGMHPLSLLQLVALEARFSIRDPRLQAELLEIEHCLLTEMNQFS